jgi:hypothetical protein
VSFGSRPTSSPPFRPRPSGRVDERSAFAVGSRALVTPTGTDTKNVQLLDEDGLPTAAYLGVDVAVVITAWRPRRMATPRYRVRSTDGVEGWVDATNLRRIPPPPPPPSPVAATPVIAPKAPAPVKAAARKPAPPPKAKQPARPRPKPAAKPARTKARVKKKPAARRPKKRVR